MHLPFCRQICPHCPYNRTLLRREQIAAYGLALERELEVYLQRPDLPPVETLYFGGGTPSQTPELALAASLGCTIAMIRSIMHVKLLQTVQKIKPIP